VREKERQEVYCEVEEESRVVEWEGGRERERERGRACSRAGGRAREGLR